MPVAPDPAPELQQYASPERLVTTQWLADHLGEPGIVVVESDEDVLLYDTGHIPGAASKPWKNAANDDGTFKAADDLRNIYEKELGLAENDDVIVYCRIGERSSHTWFVLHHLLGFPTVRNYDGSWTEWGNLVGAPVEKP